MPKSIKITDFTAGWCPSDDEKNGRQNALLHMENAELDTNGAISSTQGDDALATLTSTPFEIYSSVINGSRIDFMANIDGTVSYLQYTTLTTLLSGGDTQNAAFSTAFDYILICSGNKKIKTNIINTYNLGITNPQNAPVVAVGVSDHTDIFAAPNYHYQDWSYVRAASSTIVNAILCNCDASENWVNAGDAPFTFDQEAPPGFSSAFKFSVPKNTSKSFDLTITYPTPANFIPPGSNDFNSDSFSWWFKQTAGSMAGLIVKVTDVNNAVATYGYSTPYFPSTVITNSWVNYSFGVRDDGGDISVADGKSFYTNAPNFDWSKITKMEIYGPNFKNINADSTIWIGGFEFIGLNVISSTQPIEGTGAGWPALTINKDKAVFETDLLTTPVNFQHFPGTATAEDTDIFSFFIRGGVSGQPIYGDNSCITSIQISILLSNPGSYFTAGSNYYTYLWKNPGITGNSDITINIPREDFVRNGTGAQQWDTVYAVMFVVNVNSPVYVGIGGSIVPGVTFPGNYATFTFFGGSSALDGTYDYFQVNVNNTGSYVAKSGAGPKSLPITVVNGKVLVTPVAPTDPQDNEVWIFREGGTLDQPYRVKVLKPPSMGVQFVDELSDIDAQEIDITWNFNLTPVSQLGKIFDIVGPIEGRWFYFTADTMWPSDINDPDLYDASRGVRTCGSTSEIFLWADKVAEAAVLIGTSKDVYVLSGTFVSLPDGAIDIYYRPLPCANPPVSYDSLFYNSSVYYLAKDGWRTVDASGNCVSLTIPSTDRLYRGMICHGYSPTVIPEVPGSVRFPIAINRDKLYCVATNAFRIEVFDLSRRSWRMLHENYNVTALCSTQGGKLLGAYNSVLHSIGSRDANAGPAFDFHILTPQYDNGAPRQRKDPYTFRIRTGENTATGYLNYTVKSDTGTKNGQIYCFGTNQNDYIVDFSDLAKSRWFQFSFQSNFAIVLEEFELYYDDRPVELTFVRGFNDNFGTASKKRVRTWPFVIDTLGVPSTIVPTVDNVNQPPLTVTTNEKTTVLYFFKTDVFGIDYGYTIKHTDGSATGFEHWGSMTPEVVEVLPVAKQYDQVGPFDFMRYGKIQKIEFRLLSYGSPIHYKVFMNEVVVLNDDLVTVIGADMAYYVNVPKGTAGNVVRIELGPTGFDFHRIAVRILCSISGKDTENLWINL